MNIGGVKETQQLHESTLS